MKFLAIYNGVVVEDDARWLVAASVFEGLSIGSCYLGGIDICEIDKTEF